MKLIQPYPDYSCEVCMPEKDRTSAACPVYYIRYRYSHHARTSGYDRLCDYVAGEEVRLSRFLYWMGETVLRIPLKLMVLTDGHYEYSRYDAVKEIEVIRHFLTHRNSVYHFVYGEKSYHHLARFAGRNGNKIVVTIHHPPEHVKRQFRTLDHFRKVDFIVVVSKLMIPFWSGVVGHDKVAYVPYAVDASYFAPAEAREAGRPMRCVFVGYHERDFDGLPALVASILKNSSNLEFVMLSPDSRCQAAASVHANAVWHRRVTDQQYLQYLQQSDLMVLPLRRSTTNTAVLEAMACGLPVITNQGGIEDYLDPQCSVVLPVGDMEGMATVVCQLLKDNQRRNAMSKAAGLRAGEFSWPRTAEKMVSIYERLLGPYAHESTGAGGSE